MLACILTMYTIADNIYNILNSHHLYVTKWVLITLDFLMNCIIRLSINLKVLRYCTLTFRIITQGTIFVLGWICPDGKNPFKTFFYSGKLFTNYIILSAVTIVVTKNRRILGKQRDHGFRRHLEFYRKEEKQNTNKK